MKRIILISIIGVLVTTGLYAQKAYKSGSKVILEMTVAAGMPVGAQTAESKTYRYSSSVYSTPSNTVLGTINGTSNDHDHPLNAAVYQKLEIAPADVNMEGVIGGSTGIFIMDWATALVACRSSTYDSGSGGWRLPTQRELQMMWIFKPALENLGITAFSPEYYWSATEYNATNAWNVTFLAGHASNYGKSYPNYMARCVREL